VAPGMDAQEETAFLHGLSLRFISRGFCVGCVLRLRCRPRVARAMGQVELGPRKVLMDRLVMVTTGTRSQTSLARLVQRLHLPQTSAGCHSSECLRRVFGLGFSVFFFCTSFSASLCASQVLYASLFFCRSFG
jgi:hypothetical protein